MNSPLRIGVLGLTHDHIWSNLEELHALEGATLVAAFDLNQPLLDEVRKLYGCSVYTNADAMIETENLDAVCVFSSNRENEDLCIKASRKGLHSMIEKPLASNLAGAEAMLAAATENDVRLMINWPFAWWPQLREAIRLAEAGEIGKLWQVKYRAAHRGPREEGCSDYFCDWLYNEELNGGGALMDYCCYGSILSRVVLGQPDSVIGMQGRFCKTDIEVEDNAMFILRYPEAMATTEASWTQVGKLTAYTTTIYGEHGTILVEPRGACLRKTTVEEPEGVEIPIPETPASLAHASAHFLHCLTTGEEFYSLCRAELCRDAQAILETGRQSAREQREISM